ncbi:beta-lactamase/transpeptidase-like protein [Mycena rebaudengoi]|nr:beta-lactamase/transpeptidase-like protein [Mycena rebaudengoi]
MHWSSLLLLVSLGIHASAVDSTSDQILTPEIDTAISKILSDWNTPGGAAVAVVRMVGNGDWLTETKGYGTASIDGTKVEADTIFSIGSNSKARFPQLQRLTPQISWKTKIASIIPTWKLMDPVASAESTITDLMSHRTGLPRHDFMFSMSDNISSVIERLQYLKPSTGFREDLQYNNLMYSVLSYLPTALLPGHPPFARYVKEHIFDPLGLNSTMFSFAAANETGRMADGFVRLAINNTESPIGPGTPLVVPYWLPNVREDGDLFSGVGGVMSTATDMAQWLKVLLLNGQHPDTNVTVIPGDVIQKVATGVTIWEGTASSAELSPIVYGAGQHGGDGRGFHSQVTRLPFDGLGIAVLTNDDNYGPLFREAIKYRIIDAALGLEPVDWSARYQASVFADARLNATTTPPGAPLPPPTIASLARKYRNPGYGPDIELCAIGGGDPKSESAHCSALVSHVNTTFPASLSGATLVWEWGRFLATYALLTHFKGAVFNVTGWAAVPTTNTSLFPAGYLPYDAGLGGSTVEFAFGGESSKTVEGFGFKGGMWGAMVSEEPVGQGVKGASEVWFEAI